MKPTGIIKTRVTKKDVEEAEKHRGESCITFSCPIARSLRKKWDSVSVGYKTAMVNGHTYFLDERGETISRQFSLENKTSAGWVTLTLTLTLTPFPTNV